MVELYAGSELAAPARPQERDEISLLDLKAQRLDRLDFVFGKKVPLVMFAARGPLTRDAVVAYAVSDEVAPQRPHRSRIVLPLPNRGADLDALIVHELTHLLVGEIILPEQPGERKHPVISMSVGPLDRTAPGRNLTPVMARLDPRDLEVLDALITAGIVPNRAEGVRWALTRIRERPAYTQLREHIGKIDELKAQL